MQKRFWDDHGVTFSLHLWIVNAEIEADGDYMKARTSSFSGPGPDLDSEGKPLSHHGRDRVKDPQAFPGLVYLVPSTRIN